MKMRRFVPGLILLTLLLPALAIAQGGIHYEKAILGFRMDGPEPYLSQLRSAVKPQLEETHRLVSPGSADRQFIANIAKNGKNELTYDRRHKIHTCSLMLTAEIYRDGKLINGGIQEDYSMIYTHRSQVSKEDAIAQCVASMKEQILRLSAKYFPTLGTIRDIDDGVVYLNRGTSHGLKVGTVCDVYDETGKPVGAIRITDAGGSQATAKFITGEDEIDIGYTFESRTVRANAGFLFEAFYVPVDAKVGPGYSELVSTSDLDDISSAYAFRGAFRFPIEKFSLSWGAGVLKIGDKHPFFSDVLFRTPDLFLVFDKVSLHARGGAGAVFHGGRPYARPDGVDYGDPLDNTGDTGWIIGWVGRGGIGLNYWLDDGVTLSVEVDYCTSGEADPEKEFGEGENSDYYKIDPTYVEYSELFMDGPSISIMVTSLTDLMKW